MKKKILFLCTGNSCRSQMAEGWCRYLLADKLDCYSAGTHKHGMNPWAIRVMKDVGVDISLQYSKTVDELAEKKFDLVITVCSSAHEACPIFSGSKTVHIGFDDPPSLTRNMTSEKDILEVYERVRDQIKDMIKTLPDLLNNSL